MYVTLDPAHMIKLARNAFAALKVLKSPDGAISFSYVEELVRLQENMGLHLANKVSM